MTIPGIRILRRYCRHGTCTPTAELRKILHCDFCERLGEDFQLVQEHATLVPPGALRREYFSMESKLIEVAGQVKLTHLPSGLVSVHIQTYAFHFIPSEGQV